MNPSKPTKAGKLNKYRNFLKGWKERYFKLERSYLHYFETQYAATPVGSITRGDISLVKPCNSYDFPGQLFVFELHTKTGLIWYLQASSQDEMMSWVRTLYPSGYFVDPPTNQGVVYIPTQPVVSGMSIPPVQPGVVGPGYQLTTANQLPSGTCMAAPHGPFAQGSHPQDARIQGPYPQGVHTQGPYPQGAHTQDSHSQGAHIKGPPLQGAGIQGQYPQGVHTQGPYSQGAHTQGPPMQGARIRDPYSHGAHTQGPYPQGAQTQGAYPQGAHTQGPYPQGAHTVPYPQDRTEYRLYPQLYGHEGAPPFNPHYQEAQGPGESRHSSPPPSYEESAQAPPLPSKS